jgi:hypothetical protein
MKDMGMDMSSMPGMEGMDMSGGAMRGVDPTAEKNASARLATGAAAAMATMDNSAMAGMDHSGMDHSAMAGWTTARWAPMARWRAWTMAGTRWGR